ncbi:MAG: hypothetical protein ABGA11_08975, partial [Liquorilactobacillus hordei]|uniref:hypothetical protein n=1 Tax=Liquorilactobacillus hordei TaxID=468911 RepID=UPI0039EB890D
MSSQQEADTGGHHRTESEYGKLDPSNSLGKKENPILVRNSSNRNLKEVNEENPKSINQNSSEDNRKLLYSEVAKQNLPNSKTDDEYKFQEKEFQKKLYQETRFNIKTTTNIDPENKWNKIFTLTTETSFTKEDVNDMLDMVSIKLVEHFPLMDLTEINVSFEAHRNPINQPNFIKVDEKSNEQLQLIPYLKKDITYLKMYFDEEIIEDETNSNKITEIFTNMTNELQNIRVEQYQTKPSNKYAMIKIQFPINFPKVHAKEATYRALSKYGTILDHHTFKNKNQLAHISRNAIRPTIHYVLMELNSNSLPPPKDYISFVNGDKIFETPFSTQVSMTEPYCTACSTIGHKANKCPLNSKCSNCHRKGHCYITCKSIEIDHKIDTFKTLTADAQKRFISIRETQGRIPFYLRKDFNRESYIPQPNPNTRNLKRSKNKADYPNIEEVQSKHLATSSPLRETKPLVNNSKVKLDSIFENATDNNSISTEEDVTPKDHISSNYETKSVEETNRQMINQNTEEIHLNSTPIVINDNFVNMNMDNFKNVKNIDTSDCSMNDESTFEDNQYDEAGGHNQILNN